MRQKRGIIEYLKQFKVYEITKSADTGVVALIKGLKGESNKCIGLRADIDALGIEAYGVPSDLRTYSAQLKHDARETLARVKDFFKVMIRPESEYITVSE